MKRFPLQLQWNVQPLLDGLDPRGGGFDELVLLGGQARQQQSKLIAAHPGHRGARVRQGAQHMGHLAQQCIAR